MRMFLNGRHLPCEVQRVAYPINDEANLLLNIKVFPKGEDLRWALQLFEDSLHKYPEINLELAMESAYKGPLLSLMGRTVGIKNALDFSYFEYDIDLFSVPKMFTQERFEELLNIAMVKPTFDLRAHINRIIESRIKQHRDNLAGWSEGERCDCEIGKGARSGASRDRVCPFCDNSGIKAGTKGYLLPTEPDPEERDLVRMRLKVAIEELEVVLKEIG